MNKETLKKGTRIFYGGDMANDEGFGTITSQQTDKFGDFLTIKMDDGREFKSLTPALFSEEYLGHGGTRWVTKEAWEIFRKKTNARFIESAKATK
ncbi:hypothetical protein LCGC14_0879910 [marine sediment metagenome]|uniref:Uncharacterized protein n=1 Tax=marine sediment metagenome TaxID=412755 RepID=A0A0F9P748_9ZZZZ